MKDQVTPEHWKYWVGEQDWPRVAAYAAEKRAGTTVPFLGGKIAVITNSNIPEDKMLTIRPDLVMMHPKKLLELSVALEPGLTHAQRVAAWSRIQMNIRLRGGLPSLDFILNYARNCSTLAPGA